jgi:hypothetical protein
VTLTADDLAAWPPDARAFLGEQKVLAPSRPATHVTCDACHDDHVEEVTRIKVGKEVVFRIPCPDAGWVDVPEERLRQWTVGVRQLVTLLSAAIGSSHPANELIRGSAWQIGTIEVAGEFYDIVFVRVTGSAEHDLLNQLAAKHPPARTIVIGTRVLPNENDRFAASLPLPSAFMLAADGVAILLARVRSVISAHPNATGNVFRRKGDKWVVCFDGITIYPEHSVGLIYIARLLAEPHRDIPSVTLFATRVDVDPRAVSGSSGELLTDETLKNYSRRLQDLEDEIQEAKAFRNIGLSANLENEQEQLKKEMSRAFGLGGRIRRNDDQERIRKAVLQAISNEKRRIAKKHQSLGRHLKFIKCGTACRYSPERQTDWLT